MFSKHRFGAFLLGFGLLLAGMLIAPQTAQAHEAAPIACLGSVPDCPQETSSAQHCCVSVSCITGAISVSRTVFYPVTKVMLLARPDRYEHTHMYSPGVDVPPPRALS